MHEERLGTIIADFLTGERLEATSYEQERQALAGFLVKERGYPPDCIQSKLYLPVSVDGAQHGRLIDFLVVSPANEPLALVLFNPGDPATFVRESLAAARLCAWPPNAALPGVPLVVVTDAKKALLLRTNSGERLAQGAAAFPRYGHLAELAGADLELTTKAQAGSAGTWDLGKEARILAAYEQVSASCCQATCKPSARAVLPGVVVNGRQAYLANTPG